MGKKRGIGTILLVDDDAGLRRIFATMLAIHGVVVRTATNSRSALDVLSRERPDDVLVDLCLSDSLGIDRSGLDVIRKVLAADPTLHVALFTGWLTKKVEDEVDDLKTVDILQKPATAAQILAWTTKKSTQLNTSSGREEDVAPRRLLYVSTSARRWTAPAALWVKSATTVDTVYQELSKDYELVLIDGRHEQVVGLTAIAAEQGLCVYALTTDADVAARARRAGAAGSVSPSNIDTLATVPLVASSISVPVSPWACAGVQDLIVRVMPHEEKVEWIHRLLLEDARIRHSSSRISAAAVGMARATFIRRLTPKDSLKALPNTSAFPAIEISPWVCTKIQEIITTPMRHDRKVKSIERLLIEDALVHYKTVNAAAGALRMSRSTLMRHLTQSEGQERTSSDAENRKVSNHGQGSTF